MNGHWELLAGDGGGGGDPKAKIFKQISRRLIVGGEWRGVQPKNKSSVVGGDGYFLESISQAVSHRTVVAVTLRRCLFCGYFLGRE